MPTDWNHLGHECLSAARTLRESKMWRSATNRAYYGLFSVITHRLVMMKVPMPKDWEGPRHKPVVDGTLIADKFGSKLSAPDVGRLIHITSRLYKLRCLADYTPSVQLGKVDADTAIAFLIEGMRMLEKAA